MTEAQKAIMNCTHAMMHRWRSKLVFTPGKQVTTRDFIEANKETLNGIILSEVRFQYDWPKPMPDYIRTGFVLGVESFMVSERIFCHQPGGHGKE